MSKILTCEHLTKAYFCLTRWLMKHKLNLE